MPATYEPIASTTLGSDAVVEFTSIPSTFTDLIVVAHYNVTSGNGLVMRFNSDTGTNYSNTSLWGSGSSAGSYRDSGQSFVGAGTYYLGGSSSRENVSVIHIMSYANTNVFKTVLVASGAASRGAERQVGLYRSTTAISSIRLAQGGGFSGAGMSGSSFALYGIKAA